MIKKILVLSLVLAFSLSAAGVQRSENMTKKASWKNDSGKMSKLAFAGSQGATFDKSGNGYGWYWGNSRRVQTNLDPSTGLMVGSMYRRLDTVTGTGTIGGLTGTWGSAFEGYAQVAYSQSLYQTSGTNPGGRFPHTTEFINGYLFGAFTDMDITTEYGTPIFTVCDATFGWDLAMWSDAKRIETTEGGAVIPNAWTTKGDVVYDADTGYYYWTSWWDTGNEAYETAKYTMTVGRTTTPADPASWVWTDYNDFYLDCATGTGLLNASASMEIAYAKDIYGNGTGYGIVVAGFDDDYLMTNLAGDTLDVSGQTRLGYAYTTNWGMDDSTGDIKSNWIYPENNLFGADIYKLFDWYGTELTDTLSIDSITGEADVQIIPLNWPYIVPNVHAVATEGNMVHVLIKAFASSTEAPDYVWFRNEEKVIAGYYDIVGTITDSGVTWHSANYIAAWMGLDTENWEDMEWAASNTHKLSIGYAGNGVVYASWLDRPESRYLVPPAEFYPTPDTAWIDDAFFCYSPDHGRTWMTEKTVTVPNETNPDMPYELKYAYNVTKTNNLMEEGWNVSNHGTNTAGVMNVYAACQYADTANPIAPPNDSFRDYQQFLKIWKITGTETGIEMEEVSLTKDFNLYQNYPNPFNPSTEIRFALQNESKVKLTVYNAKGELVANLKNEKLNKGVHSVNFDAKGLNSGVYFYKLDVNGMAESKKMILTK